MKIIVEGDDRIKKILGKQSIKFDNTRYRLMKYLLQVDCDDGILLHNVITGQLVKLNLIESEMLSRLPLVSNSNIIELIHNYYLVPEEYDENSVVVNLRLIINRILRHKKISLFTILTTTNCNARCFYCYEKNLTRIDMDEYTANSVADFILSNKNPGKIQLHWFGGEPLVCAKQIDQISKKLQYMGIEYSSSMTSNGYLFTPELIKKAIELWDLKEIQITLDGNKDSYNRIKSYVEVDLNPYARVLNNIELLLQSGVQVSIRLNFDQHNEHSIKELICELSVRYGQYPNVSVYPHYILYKPEFFPFKRSTDEEDELLKKQYEIETQLVNLGLKKRDMSLPRLRSRSCGADTEDSVVIYPDGRIFRCIEINEEDQVGDIWHSEINNTNIQKYQESFELESCVDCPLFPYCILLKKCPDSSKRNYINCDNKLRRQIAIIKELANQSCSF